MIQNETTNLNHLHCHFPFVWLEAIRSKKVKMVIGMNCKGKTKSKRCDSAMQKNDSRKALLL